MTNFIPFSMMDNSLNELWHDELNTLEQHLASMSTTSQHLFKHDMRIG